MMSSSRQYSSFPQPPKNTQCNHYGYTVLFVVVGLLEVSGTHRLRSMSCDFVIGFDADDTLWHNEIFFDRAHQHFCQLLSQTHPAEEVERVLFATEMRNLELYGYGIKSFTLSSIETAIALTNGRISTAEIRQIILLGQEMLSHPIDLLDGVTETLASLSAEHMLILITKGDLRDQERKLAESGLADRFHHIEIVSEKTPATYERILKMHAIAPQRFFMIGNSLRSDVIPVLKLGGASAHVPYPLTWQHERVDHPPVAPGRFFSVKSLREVPAIVRDWMAATS